MDISITAKPSSSQEKVEKNKDGSFSVWIKEPPIEGKANKAIIKAVAEYFNVRPNKVQIVRGFASRNKILRICE